VIAWAHSLLRGMTLLGVLALAQAPAAAQILNVHVLDVDDNVVYREWAKKEFEIGKKDQTSVAARAINHATKTQSEVPTIAHTAVPSEAPGQFWTASVPAWVKRFSSNPFTSQPLAGKLEGITKMFQGLSTYQKARATMRTLALIKTSIAGMRFEINAWKLMKNIDVTQFEKHMVPEVPEVEGTRFSTPGTPAVTVLRPLGTVSFGIVPRGKENWRAVVEYLKDDPQYDTAAKSRIKYKGPRSLSDVSVEAQEAVTGTGAGYNTEMEDWLEIADRKARAVAEGLATLRAEVNNGVGQAYIDSNSPRKLYQRLLALQARRNAAVDSMVNLRALIEARPASEVAKEYAQGLTDYAADAKRALATAEASANFYQQISNQADNLVADLQMVSREEEIRRMENLYTKWLDTVNDQGVKADVDEYLKYTAKTFPVLAPFINAIELPVDLAMTLSGDAADIATDDDPDTDIKTFMQDAQARGLGVRFGHYLWQEMRVTRKLLWLLEQERAAAHGLENDPGDAEAYQRVFDASLHHEILRNQFQRAVGMLNKWKAGDAPY